MSNKIVVSKPTYSLEHCSLSIAVEAFSVASVMSALTKFMPSIAPSFKEETDVAVAGLRTLGERDKLPKEFKKAVKSLDVFRFIDLRDTPIYVPDGFTGSLPEYTAKLIDATNMCRDIAQCIADYRSYMGMVVSNERARQDTKDHTLKWLALSDKAQKQRSFIDEHFTQKPHAFLPVGDVFNNFNEITQFFKNVGALSDATDRLNPKAVVADVETASTYLDLFTKNYEEGKYKDISTQTAKAIAMGAHQVANLAETYSVLYYRFLAAGKAAEQIKQKLETIANA